MGRLRTIANAIRNLLFSSMNKEFLVFLFFLAVSGVFWLLMTLNDTYEKEFLVPVRVVNVPKNVVLTSDDIDTIKMTMRDKGLFLLGYWYDPEMPNIKLNFKTYANGHGVCAVSAAEMQRLVYQQLSASTKITGVKPDKVEFFYNYGQRKRVPVKWHGMVVPERLYFISKVEYQPDSVDVYASKAALDSLKAVYTEPLDYANFRDTLTVQCNLQRIKGIKTVPGMVGIRFFTDVLTEENMEDVPIVGVNLPEGKVLRTFPSKVTVNFVTGVKRYQSLRPSDFIVTVDYNEIAAHPSDKCNLHLIKVPSGISRASLSVKQVDYLIEEQ